MKHLTRNNIAYNLRVSPHIQEVEYDGKVLEFVFSSDLYRRKFLERREDAKQELKTAMEKRYKVQMEVTELSDVLLYSKIEKRGFLIYENGKEVLWLEDLKFAGKIMS